MWELAGQLPQGSDSKKEHAVDGLLSIALYVNRVR